jgi:hypothetical protein
MPDPDLRSQARVRKGSEAFIAGGAIRSKKIEAADRLRRVQTRLIISFAIEVNDGPSSMPIGLARTRNHTYPKTSIDSLATAKV